MRHTTLIKLVGLVFLLDAGSLRGDESAIVRHLGGGLRVELQHQPKAHFAIYGLDFLNTEQAEQQITFTVLASALEQPPAIVGETRVEKDRIVFVPRFALTPGVVYRLHLGELVKQRLDLQEIDEELLSFSLNPDRPLEEAKVSAIYPSADALPENLLKFYVHFSQPMNRGEAYRRIHLFEGETQVDEPFLVLDEELWNAQQTRFTLLIHPGRIKRGVQPRELRGPPLNEGKQYRLRIDPGWSAAQGKAMQSAYEKTFTVSAPVAEKVDPLSWKLESPTAGTRQPVGLTFAAPLDRGMLERVLEVFFNDGSRIQGSVTITNQETQWQFTPDEAWQIGAYQIQIATNLEDVCGNNLAAPFEVKLRNQTTETPAAKIAIEFIVQEERAK